MKSKITLSKIAVALSEKSGKSRKECEDILKSLFARISEALETGESVKIKGFGTFKISRVESRRSVDVTSGNDYEIPAHSKIVFLPAKELASAVNAPFEMFETIELEEGVLEEELLQAETMSDPMSTDITTDSLTTDLILEQEKKEDLEEEYPILKDDSEEEGKSEPAAESEEPEQSAESESPAKSEPSAESAELTEPGESEPTEESEDSQTSESSEESEIPEESSETPEPEREHRSGFGHGFLWGVVASVLVLALGVGVLLWLNGDFARWSSSLLDGRKTAQTTVVTPDSISTDTAADTVKKDESALLLEENSLDEIASGTDAAIDDDAVAADKVVPTQPSDRVVYDTITRTHYLTTMAKKHYGNYHLWPYIYKENEKFLGHPDRIRPGTRVVIPNLSKYGVDPKNKADIEKAKKMGVEIYARYNK